MTKFIIRKDDRPGTYWTLSSPNIDPSFVNQRNVLAIYNSTDLLTWHRTATLLEDDSGLSPEESAAVTGFQYAGWQFAGADIPYVLRTASRRCSQLPRFQSHHLPPREGFSEFDRLTASLKVEST